MHLYKLPSIDYLRLRFHLKALNDCDLPAWKGSLLRGAFGHALRRTVCTMKQGQLCENCMLRAQCAYTRLFETFVTETPPRFLHGQVSSPRPFIFEPQDKNKNYPIGEILWFDLILISEAINYLPYVIFAVYQMGKQGLGVKRHPFHLETVYCYQPEKEQKQNDNPNIENNHWQAIYDGAREMILFAPEPIPLKNTSVNSNSFDSVMLKFLTQTRLKFKDELTMEFNFRMLVFKMIRRILELAYFYTDQKDINWEFHDLLEAADNVEITKRNLHWEDWQRYSNRQKTKMKFGGFIGDIALEGDLAPFRDLLAYSEVLHVGKGATFGLGKLEIEKK